MSKLKAMFAVFVAGFIGIISNPEMLAASDSVAINGINNAGIVETVPAPEPEVVAETEVVETVYYEPTYYEPVYQEPVYQEPVYQMPTNYIQISGLTIPLGYTTTTAENAGDAQYAWYYKSGTHIYGHNYSYVFGPLDWAYDGGYLDGMTFTVVMDGVVNNYTVVTHRLYDRLDAYTLGLNGKQYGMLPIVNAYLDETDSNYRMTIMTCYNGSAQRLVLYAN